MPDNQMNDRSKPMKSYFVAVNCTGFRWYKVTAKTRDDAESKARQHFQCDYSEGEVSRSETHLMQPDDEDTIHEELEVWYPDDHSHEALSSN